MSSDGQTNDVSELSIEETNKLRIKLGLKPLEIDSGPKASSSQSSSTEEKSYEKRGEVFVQTASLADQLEAEKLREKFAIQREKRLQAEKLKSIKTIAEEIDDDDLDPFAWVNKSRENENKSTQPLKESKHVPHSRKSSQNEKEMIERQKMYNENHVKGLKVNHALDSISESQSIILTLRDREVLDEQGEDELENVNLKDDEKARENVFNRKHGTRDYNPYETQESLLSKYDDKESESFRIGAPSSSSYVPSQSETPSNTQQSLNTLQIKFASEFYTPQEMEAKFKKRKKKVVKKSSFRQTSSDAILDDPVPADTKTEEKSSKSRKRKVDGTLSIDVKDHSTRSDTSAKETKPSTSLTLEDEPMDEDDDNYIPGVVDDEAELELQEALEKVRRKKQPVVSITNLISNLPVAESTDDAGSSNFLSSTSSIILDSTSEFCRALGETSGQFKGDATDIVASIKTIKSEDDSEMASLSQEEHDDDEDEEVHARSKKRRSRREEDEDSRKSRSSRGKDKWTEVKLEAEESTLYEKLKSQPILEEEPDVSVGVASALQLAYQKGYLEREAKKSASAPVKSSELMAKGYSIEEKFRDDDRRGYRGDRGGYSGNSSISEFKEKANYKPDVKLEYVDDNGRLLNQKEAFRVLSHKFHGKGPGKNKIDKRMKKLEQESKLRQMSCIDTPLNTVHKLQEKQKELQLPYVVISGSGSTLVKK